MYYSYLWVTCQHFFNSHILKYDEAYAEESAEIVSAEDLEVYEEMMRSGVEPEEAAEAEDDYAADGEDNEEEETPAEEESEGYRPNQIFPHLLSDLQLRRDRSQPGAQHDRRQGAYRAG